ncbi:MAG: hypothetical protein MI861_00730 [Pirellulales bacterium]|nr:hypothetical protein [Pirellulales bacterium]
MNTIRTFRNTDVPALAEIWTQHWSTVTVPPLVTVPIIERAILSRTFFDPSALLIAENQGKVQGWSHFVGGGHAVSSGQADPRRAQIVAICLRPEADLAMGHELITVTVRRIQSVGFQQVHVGPVRDNWCGYAGLEPIGHGIGVPQRDTRLVGLLGEHEFSAGTPLSRFAVSTLAYRPPISREALQFRRTTSIQQEVISLCDPHQASAMAHIDMERHRLLDRGGQELASVDLWLSDPEAEVMSAGHAILDFPIIHQRGHLEPAEAFLIGSVVQNLAERRISRLESSIDSDRTQLCQQMKALNFQAEDHGTTWTRQLES